MSHAWISGRSMLVAPLVLGTLLPGVARAEVTAEQAAALQAQVQAGVQALIGPSVTLPAGAVRMTAAGDHYDVSIPMVLPGAKPAADGKQASMTGQAKPGDNGVWTLSQVAMTSPFTFTVELPVPAAGADVKPQPGARPAKPVMAPVTYVVTFKGQDGGGVFDPSFATPSTLSTSAQGLDMTVQGGLASHMTTAGPSMSKTVLTPVGPDRVDGTMESSIQNYSVKPAEGAALPFTMTMQGVKVAGAMHAVSREQFVALMHAATPIVVRMVSGPRTAQGAPPPPTKPEMRALLASFAGLANDMTLDETLDGMEVQAQGVTVAMQQARFAMDMKSDAGMLGGGLEIGASGLTLPGAPLGELTALVPTRVGFHPYVAGLSVADLTRMANAGLDGRDPTDAEVAALFSHGGVTGGLRSMVLEMGGAVFSGQGQVVALGPTPEMISGTATITAEHFDDLMQKVSANPQLAGQAVPVMALAKGLGRMVDGKLVWDITFKDQKLLVNNVDLEAMMGGAPKGGPAPARPDAGGAAKAPAPPAAAPAAPRGRPAAPSWGK